MATLGARFISLRKQVFPLLALVLVCLHPGLLLSEDQTMTTYYPAPYGGYVSILTTDKTVLAKDGGNVGIGTSNPASKLDVAGNAKVTGNVTATGIVTGGDVRVGANSVVTAVNCGPTLSCTRSGNTVTINAVAPTSCTGCSAPTPACGKTTTGVDSCGKRCTLTGAPCACVPNGTCTAAAPACDQITYGVDNCGTICSRTGTPCCVPNGSCSAASPACDKTTYGVDNCGTSCSKTGVKCSCYWNCSPEECYVASVSCQESCGPVAFGNLIHRGLCMTACNLSYPQCVRF